MRLFTKKLESKNKNTKKKKKRKKGRTFKNPSDVKLFYRMPLLLAIGITCVLIGVGISWNNSKNYKAELLTQSMPKGTDLPIRKGTSGEGHLKLGNSLLSSDGKTLAVEISYDDTAHSSLSSFGTNYKLDLIDTKNNLMTNVKVSYGMFGTDGSGVLQIHSDNGFRDKAFMIFLIDKGVIVTNDKLQMSRTMTDAEIDQSLAKQLEAVENSDSSEESSTEPTLPPTYKIRLNAHNTQKSYRNWSNDSELVSDLFVEKNLKKIEKNVQDIKTKIKLTKESLSEMTKRLEKNSKDSTAESNKQTLESTLSQLEDNLGTAQKNYDTLSKTTIGDNILNPKQTNFKKYTVTDINHVE
ncbi:hypothetical protein [Lactococcus lactis]|uniref:hypothetical protein n=1 Tax=Lactococcus lactis TaxID=1358 RepID=UPI001912C569|nr:hypothetical protein [Lactococcus lactis]WDA67443.1 hypothetical protein IL310_01370 [Lactococcus lactis]WDA67486.1 hypothetical protein IL310_01005 [Lactococcus lactis]